jgi:hypothetical protein
MSDERKAFEAALRAENFDSDHYFRRDATLPEDYDDVYIHCRWEGWQLARSAQPSPDAVSSVQDGGMVSVPLMPNDAMQLAGAEAIRIDTTPINKLFMANRAWYAMVDAALASKPSTTIQDKAEGEGA